MVPVSRVRSASIDSVRRGCAAMRPLMAADRAVVRVCRGANRHGRSPPSLGEIIDRGSLAESKTLDVDTLSS